MAIKEKFKYIELDGRKWVIGKMDARTGSYIAAKLMVSALPAAMEAQLNLPNMPKGRSFMSKEEFYELQNECLRVCYQDLPAGKAAVISDNDAWGVADVEDDMVLVISLTVHALLHNVKGFFEGNAFKDLLASFKGMKLAGVSM
jgi:hypothetical protein